MTDTSTSNTGIMLDTFRDADSGGHPDWLVKVRQSAAARAFEIGFPTTSHEEWRFTNIAPLLELPLHPAPALARKLSAEDIAPFTFGMEGHRLVFVDGHFCPELSIVRKNNGEIQIGSLRAQLAADPREPQKHLCQHAVADANMFTALNTAFFQDGAYIYVAPGKDVEVPVHLLYVTSNGEQGAVAQPRNLIIAQKNSGVKILETYASIGNTPTLTNSVTEIIVGPDAHVEHCKIQTESEQSFHVGTIQARLDRNSRWTSHSIAFGSRLARNQIQALFGAEGATCVLNGLYVGRGEQVIDHHTVVDHAKPNCESHEYYHGILADRSHGVFNGKIFVQQDAQKTNAKQTNRNLLLSETAVIDTKPQLEIFADDVKCTHGATVGQLNDEQIFYLRARGIGLEDARRMLIHAFANDVVERITLEPARVTLAALMGERFLCPN